MVFLSQNSRCEGLNSIPKSTWQNHDHSFSVQECRVVGTVVAGVAIANTKLKSISEKVLVLLWSRLVNVELSRRGDFLVVAVCPRRL